jgi:hypothetical protein
MANLGHAKERATDTPGSITALAAGQGSTRRPQAATQGIVVGVSGHGGGCRVVARAAT